MSDKSANPPSITLRGFTFKISVLAKQRPVHLFGYPQEGQKDAMIWDVPQSLRRPQKLRKVVCLCFDIVERIDGCDVDRLSHGLLGLLLEPVEGGAAMDPPAYRRIGFYNGL